MSDERPMWPPGQEITAQAFDAFAEWERKWADDLEEIESVTERAQIYSCMHDGIDIDLAKAMVAQKDVKP